MLVSCATPTTPTGGPRDEAPPVIDTALSTPNFQTKFLKQDISLTFNEWVQLEDVFNQVIISPPLQYKPEIYVKKKSVVIGWDDRETLRENVTYTFNFGESVKDLTEKNPAEKLRFVFSTGDFIDSLSLSGKVVDALDGKPLEKIRVMLYNSTQDSVVRTQKPLYLSLTDKEGRFTMENIRSDTFSLFALEDVNFNYKFDLGNERIGFPDSVLILNFSRTDSLTLQVFPEKPTLRVKDTLKLWFNPTGTKTPWQIGVQSGLNSIDTLKFNTSVAMPAFDKLRVENAPESGVIQQNIKPGAPLEMSMLRPLSSFDASKIIQIQDSIPVSDTLYFVQDSIYPRKFLLHGRWQEGNTYKLNIPPGAIQDIYGKTTDSLRVSLTVGKTEDYGNLVVKIGAIDSNMHYVVQVTDESQRILYEKQIHGNAPEGISLNLLSPGKYTLKVIKDGNNNGIWDTGSLQFHRQPEKIVLIPVEEIKANWDVETSVNLIQIFKE